MFGDIMRRGSIAPLRISITMPNTPHAIYPTSLMDELEFPKKLGKCHEGGKKESVTSYKKERQRQRDERRTSGLISQQCDLFALYWHKEPTLLCHYVTKKGVIGQ